MRIEEFKFFKSAKKNSDQTWIWEKSSRKSRVTIESRPSINCWTLSVVGAYICFWPSGAKTVVGQIANDPDWPRTLEEALSIIEMDELTFLKMGFGLYEEANYQRKMR